MKNLNYFFFLSLTIIPVLATYLTSDKKEPFKVLLAVNSKEDLKKLFPKTADDITILTSITIKEAQDAVTKIVSIPSKDHNRENTLYAYDRALTHFRQAYYILRTLLKVSPLEVMKEAERQSVILKKQEIDLFLQNKDLYNALSNVARNVSDLSKKEQYFLDTTLQEYKRKGLDLADDRRNKAATLEKEIAELSTQFSQNIALDASTIQVSREELVGLDEDFINNLKTENGLYILGVDYPTYYKVISFADCSQTRRKIFDAFNNRAYPQNVSVLETLIEKHDQLAQVLGFPSYGHLALESDMVKTPERAEQFLKDLLEKVNAKETLEFEHLTKNLPSSVTLSSSGKMHPWDRAYAIEHYKKNNFNIDEDKISHYFPMDHTIQQLLNIYQQFLDIEIKEEAIDGLWHPDVKLVTVHQNKELRGYLLLDLHPRENKYSHAVELTVIPALKTPHSTLACVTVVVANFPKATATQPALLKRKDVTTFFHEFGHALHAILGATKLGSLSGNNVKVDFAEMPSQMLEEWLWDPAILKQVSHHYITGESLPEDTIQKLIDLKIFSSGNDAQRQIALSFFSLACFKAGEHKNTDALLKEIFEKVRMHEEYYENYHFHTSFPHLGIAYNTKYYSYLWSKVFALALFDHIKKYGLLNPEIGRHYKHTILEQGGSKDPNELLVDFLGHAPTQDAFIRDLGL
jgi:thimet oligopeptidase